MLCWSWAFIPIVHSVDFIRDVHSLRGMPFASFSVEVKAGVMGQVTSQLGSGIERR